MKQEDIMKTTGMLIICLTALLLPAGNLLAQQPLAGDWEGAIELPGVNLGIIVRFAVPDNSLSATIDIPMQMAKGLRLTNVRADHPAVHFELPAGPGLAIFDGVIAGDSITGDFRQAGVVAKFRLRRMAGPKPTEKAAPPPYREEEVRISSDTITLAGTLSTPREGGPFPAVILITGSGAQNRDEEIFGFAPFRILADHFTRNGFAVLRCDDRGIGGSTGDMSTSTTADFSKDVRAMVRYLQDRPEIRRSMIGLLGHSEGSHVAAMTAAGSSNVAFAILLAGPAVRGDSVILSQIRTLSKEQGETDENIQHSIVLQRRVFATVRDQKGWDELRAVLLEEMRRSLDRLPTEQRSAMGNTDSLLAARTDIQMHAIRTPWFAFFASYDPAGDLAKIRCPVLALFGELDQQVLPSLNMRPMKEALSRNGNPDVTVKVVSGANHLFQKAITGSPAEYAGLEKRFADGVLDLLTVWMKKRAH
jgi:uncharacterized protein